MQRELGASPLRALGVAIIALAATHAAAGTGTMEITDKPSILASVSSDGDLAVIATKESIIAYDLKRDAVLFELPLDDLEPPTAIAVTGSARCIAWGTASGAVILRSIPQANDYGTIRAADGAGVTALSFADAGGMLAVGSSNGDVSVWLSRNSAPRARFEGKGAAVRGIEWLPSLDAILTLTDDGRPRIANLTSFEHNLFAEKDTTATTSLAQAPGLSLVFTALADGKVQVRGLASPDTPATLPMKEAPGCRIVASADGVWLALLEKEKPVKYIRLSNGHTMIGDPLADVAFSPQHGVAVEVGEFGARSSRIGEPAEPAAPHAKGDGESHEGHSH